jgi:hypothetical protein
MLRVSENNFQKTILCTKRADLISRREIITQKGVP